MRATAPPRSCGQRITVIATVVAVVSVAVALVGPTVSSAAPAQLAAPLAPAAAGQFVSLSPTRILDTRDGLGAPKGVVGPGITIDVQVTGTLVPAGATAVAFNLTATNALGPGFVSAWPTGTERPTVSNLNLLGAGATVANLAVVALPPSGRVSLFTQSGADLVADVSGYWTPSSGGTSAAGRFIPQRPARILDTREGVGAPAGLPGLGSTVTVQVAGSGGVPAAGASAVVIVVTATEAVAQGFVSAWPAGVAQPLASILNLKAPGDTVPNLAIVPLGLGGQVSLFTQAGSHLLIDVAGWFTDGSAAPSSDGLFVPLAPERFLDSRSRSPFGKLWPGQRNDLIVAGKGAVPATAVSAVIANITSTDAAIPGYVTAWPAVTAQPVTSNLNSPGNNATVAGLTFVGVGSTGAFSLYSQSGTQIIADIAGYFLGARQPAEPGVPVSPPPPPAPALQSRPTVPGADRFTCNAGPAMDQILRVDVNPGLLVYLQNIANYPGGQALRDVAYTFMANSGPLPARVALDPEWDSWIDALTGGLAVRSPGVFLQLLNAAYHETIHDLQNGACALTGPTTGYPTPRIGFFQSETFDDVNARIDAIQPKPSFIVQYAHSVAESYLSPLGAIARQGFESQMWEINAYVLAAEWGASVNDTFGVTLLGTTVGNDDTMSIKFHQLARYLFRAQSQPALWAQLQATSNLPSAVAEQWNLGVKSWQVDKAPSREPTVCWDLAFGPDVAPIVAFTGGAAGTSAPPRPPPAIGASTGVGDPARMQIASIDVARARSGP